MRASGYGFGVTRDAWSPAGARPDFRNMWGADGLAYLSRYDGLSYVRRSRVGVHG